MTISHHPSDITLLGYAGGTLNEAASVVIATHLMSCSRCRGTVAVAEELGGALFDSLPEDALSTGALDRALDSLDRSMAKPRQTVHTSAIGSHDWLKGPLAHYNIGAWRWLAPGVRRASVISRHFGRLNLFRIAPGKSVGLHGHHGLELTCVLEGGFSDGPNSFGPGDIAETDEAIEHRPVADSDTDGECICLVATDQRLKLYGLARLVQPLLGV